MVTDVLPQGLGAVGIEERIDVFPENDEVVLGELLDSGGENGIRLRFAVVAGIAAIDAEIAFIREAVEGFYLHVLLLAEELGEELAVPVGRALGDEDAGLALMTRRLSEQRLLMARVSSGWTAVWMVQRAEAAGAMVARLPETVLSAGTSSEARVISFPFSSLRMTSQRCGAMAFERRWKPTLRGWAGNAVSAVEAAVSSRSGSGAEPAMGTVWTGV